MAGCLGTIAVGALLGTLWAGGLFSIWLWLSLALFMMGFVYGPLGAWLPGLFSSRVRYTGTSLAFTAGGILGGGLVPFVAQELATRGGLNAVGAYLALAGIASFIALWTMPKAATTI